MTKIASVAFMYQVHHLRSNPTRSLLGDVVVPNPQSEAAGIRGGPLAVGVNEATWSGFRSQVYVSVQAYKPYSLKTQDFIMCRVSCSPEHRWLSSRTQNQG